MGQVEIIKWFAVLRATEDNNYYNVNHISKYSNANLRNTQRAIRKLLDDGILEANTNEYKPEYRMKKRIYIRHYKKYVKENKTKYIPDYIDIRNT